jgi:TetR/AcrR family acrAB operon transcriptional repressor
LGSKRSGTGFNPKNIMARRTKEEAAATREALLDAAELVFRDKGVAHATLAEVAEAAGLTRGAVYWHFRDKGDLFEALCARVTLPMESMLAEAGERKHADPLAALAGLAVDGLLRLARDPHAQAVFDVIFNKCEFSADLEAVAERRRTSDGDCLSHIERLLRQAVDRGQLPPDTDVALAANCMNSFMVGAMHQWVRNPASCDLERAASSMVRTMIAGLIAAPPRLPAPPAHKRPPRKPRLRIAG